MVTSTCKIPYVFQEMDTKVTGIIVYSKDILHQPHYTSHKQLWWPTAMKWLLCDIEILWPLTTTKRNVRKMATHFFLIFLFGINQVQFQVWTHNFTMCCSFVTNSGREMAPMWLRNIQSLCYNSQQYCLYNRGVLLADGCTIYGGKFIINLPLQIADSSQKNIPWACRL